MVAVEQILTTTAAAYTAFCTTRLPANAVVALGHGLEPLTLPEPATLTVPCPTIVARQAPTVSTPASSASTSDDDDAASGLSPDPSPSGSRLSDYREPFYASTFPICYALAATTITSYMLVVMLLITPRSFLDGGVIRLSKRSFTNSSTQGVSIGGRPILQKAAAISVAISLTVATANTFSVAEEQYALGTQNARAMQDTVLGSTEMKAVRLVSDGFLWLAQAQTLIRIFPRQREKIIITWVACILIVLDMIFSGINSFVFSTNGVNGGSRHSSLSKSIPALSYILQLSLRALYALWVMYYAVLKRKYAFYHPLMKNICLVAVISVLAIIIPIIFFVLDISKPKFTAWGDYVRWVGAAASSVVVWEWVERIEALERDEKKDGILGREVFDGDDVLEVSASDWPHTKERIRKTGSSGSDETGGHDDIEGARVNHTGSSWPGMGAISRHRGGNQDSNRNSRNQEPPAHINLRPQLWPTRPAPVAAPVSRTDTPSAASTVYAVRYQPPSDTTSRSPNPTTQMTHADSGGGRRQQQQQQGEEQHIPYPYPSNNRSTNQNQNQDGTTLFPPTSRRSIENDATRSAPSQVSRRTINWTNSSVAGETTNGSDASRSGMDPIAVTVPMPRNGADERRRWDIRSRFQEIAATSADMLRDKFRPSSDTVDLPVTVIPAPARRGAALRQVLEEEEANRTPGERRAGEAREGRGSGGERARGSSNAHRSRTGGGHSQQSEFELSPNQPPLWPGVRSRYVEDGSSEEGDEDDEDEDEDDDETSSTSSENNHQGGAVTTHDSVREGDEEDRATHGEGSSSARRS